MSDELKCVSQGCNRDVIKYEKYDVNGFRFHTETHQNGRANPKTVNTGVFTRGADDFDYYRRLENVYELTFNRQTYNSISLCSSAIGSTLGLDREVTSPLG